MQLLPYIIAIVWLAPIIIYLALRIYIRSVPIKTAKEFQDVEAFFNCDFEKLKELKK